MSEANALNAADLDNYLTGGGSPGISSCDITIGECPVCRDGAEHELVSGSEGRVECSTECRTCREDYDRDRDRGKWSVCTVSRFEADEDDHWDRDAETEAGMRSANW